MTEIEVMICNQMLYVSEFR